MTLATYKRKRNFSKTPEPKGEDGHRKKAVAPLHFVVQKHDASHLHYDFRLEFDGVLKSWAVPKGPSMNPQDKRLAMLVEDHPLSYMRFEGTIPEGSYGAGEVIVWDFGNYASRTSVDREETDKHMRQGLHKGRLEFVLMGEKLKGSFALVKMANRGENAWLLIKEKDEYVSGKDVLADDSSVISKRTLPDRAAKKKTTAKRRTKKSTPKKRGKKNPMPHQVKPMLAKLAPAPFDRNGWLFEIKWDGYRAIAEIEGKKRRLYSRNDIDFSKKFPPIFDALKAIEHDCVLDGEIIALKDGTPDFHTLQQYAEVHAPLQYVLFDLLYLDGEDIRGRPLTERKALLRDILPENPQLLFSEHIEQKGKQFFEEIKKQRFEGMLAKDGTSPYLAGTRSDHWQKVKSFEEQEAVIVGFTKPRGGRKHLGALVLAAYEKGILSYIGHSGGGFTEAELKGLYQKLVKYETKKSPLEEKVPINSPITWISPHFVCQIKFSEWTPSGRMRHPIYAGLRIDKKPEEVVREIPGSTKKKTTAQKPNRKKVSEEPVQLTNPGKVFWKKDGYTKGDVAAYYESMADTILPYLEDRPENLLRNPNGIDGKGFFQKNTEDLNLPAYVDTASIYSESREREDRYLVCNNRETLQYLVNLGCIELNPWTSRTKNLERPDFMIFDIDPNGRPFDDVVLVAQELHKVLTLACEEHVPKTSGKTGIHICVPLGARYPYEQVREFSRLLMELVHARLPKMTSLERSPRKRRGKIYLDYLQNRFGQTIAAPYAIRPYPGATVSTPLEWREVKKGLDPSRFTIKTMEKRLKQKGDLWKPVLEKGIDLRESIRCLEEEHER